MPSSDDIAAALRRAVPAGVQADIPALARLLAEVASGTLSQEEAQARIAAAQLAPLLAALAGQQIDAGGAALSFGQGSQVGEVNVRDVAGGNIVHLTVNVYQAGPPAERDGATATNAGAGVTANGKNSKVAIVLGLVTVMIVLFIALTRGSTGEARPADLDVVSAPSPLPQAAESAPTATPEPCPPVDERRQLVLVVPFEGGGDVHRTLLNMLASDIGRRGLDDMIDVAEARSTSISGYADEDVERLGMRCGASIVIWGERTADALTVNLLSFKSDASGAMVREDFVSVANEFEAIGAADTTRRYVNEVLANQLKSLVPRVIAQVLLLREDDPAAIDTAIGLLQNEIAPASDAPDTARADAAFLLGWAYQTKQQNYPAAVAAYEQAVQWNDGLPDAFFNLGNARRKIAKDPATLQQAIVDYDRVLALLPAPTPKIGTTAADLYDLTRYVRGTAWLGQVQPLRDAGKELLAAGNFGAAAQKFDEAERLLGAADADLAAATGSAPGLSIAFYDYGVVLQERAGLLEDRAQLACAQGQQPAVDGEATAIRAWEESLGRFDTALAGGVEQATFNKDISLFRLGRTTEEPPAWPSCG
jgi:tetratricopeptide (TPR) repeat protein